jgi:hypothetical protein
MAKQTCKHSHTPTESKIHPPSNITAEVLHRPLGFASPPPATSAAVPKASQVQSFSAAAFAGLAAKDRQFCNNIFNVAPSN